MNYMNLTIPDYDISTKIKVIGTMMGFTIGLITIILNSIAILAIVRIRGSLPVNIRLVCCLVASDLLVSFVVIFETSMRCIFHYIGKDIFVNVTTIDSPTIDLTLTSYNHCFALILHVLRYSGYNGTLLSLTALAMDLYIAIMYPLNYTSLMRKDRVNFIIGFVFVIAFLLGGCVLYIPLINAGPTPPSLFGVNYCFERWHQQMKSTFVTFGVTIIAIIVVTVVYVTVFYEIRNFHNNAVRCPRQPYKYTLASNIQSRTNSLDTISAPHVNVPNRATSNTSNMKRNHRGLTTTLVLLLVFLCCFLPSFIEEIYLITTTHNMIHDYKYVISLAELLLNLPLICSALDPLLYSYRLKDIKLSYLRLFCCHHDHIKTNLPPLVAGRARPHPTVQIYFPTHRRSIAGTSPSANPKYSTPWSQRIARVTGIYIERIRKFSSTQSNLDTKCNKRTPTSAPFYMTETRDHEKYRQELLEDDNKNNKKACFTTPGKLPVKSSRYISAPKMVLCPWQFANKSLRESWLKEDNFESTNKPDRSFSQLERSHKFSNYSSTEGGHSGSIDSANTNSTSMSNSFHQQRSKSIDNSSLQLSSSEKKRCYTENIILEND